MWPPLRRHKFSSKSWNGYGVLQHSTWHSFPESKDWQFMNWRPTGFAPSAFILSVRLRLITVEYLKDPCHSPLVDPSKSWFSPGNYHSLILAAKKAGQKFKFPTTVPWPSNFAICTLWYYAMIDTESKFAHPISRACSGRTSLEHCNASTCQVRLRSL